MSERPLRVMHIIDTLAGGGSERLVWDIVRLSDPARVKYRVVTFFPEQLFGPFVYEEPLRELGAYGRINRNLKPTTEVGEGVVARVGQPVSNEESERTVCQPVKHSMSQRLGSTIARFLRSMPESLKTPLLRVWNSVFVACSRFRWQFAVYVPSSIRIFSEYFRFRPDVIHVHGFYGFKYGLLFKRLFRKPMVHMMPALFSQMKAQGTGWLVDHYKRFHPLVDFFILDAGYRSELLGVGVPPEKLFDVIGTVDLQAVSAAKAESEHHRREVRARLGIPQNSLIALSVGRLDPTKGHDYALEALPHVLKKVPNLHWLVLGEGWKRGELEARIRELGVKEHAHLIGFDRDPLPFYAAADIYLRTTTMEGENISSLQAIMFGLPTVGFDTHQETDLIKKLGHGRLVPNCDAIALAAATIEILSLPDTGRSLGALGMDYGRQHLDIKKQIDQFTQLYASLLKPGQQGTSTSSLHGHMSDG